MTIVIFTIEEAAAIPDSELPPVDAEAMRDWTYARLRTWIGAFRLIAFEAKKVRRKDRLDAIAQVRAATRVLEERRTATMAGATDEITVPDPQAVGIIYFIRVGDFIKIGYTAALGVRMEQLSNASPVAPVLIHQEPGTTADERAYHKQFAAHRHRLEWFRHEGALAAFLEGKARG